MCSTTVVTYWSIVRCWGPMGETNKIFFLSATMPVFMISSEISLNLLLLPSSADCVVIFEMNFCQELWFPILINYCRTSGHQLSLNLVAMDDKACFKSDYNTMPGC